jgi:hypothetical protein
VLVMRVVVTLGGFCSRRNSKLGVALITLCVEPTWPLEVQQEMELELHNNEVQLLRDGVMAVVLWSLPLH